MSYIVQYPLQRKCSETVLWYVTTSFIVISNSYSSSSKRSLWSLTYHRRVKKSGLFSLTSSRINRNNRTKHMGSCKWKALASGSDSRHSRNQTLSWGEPSLVQRFWVVCLAPHGWPGEEGRAGAREPWEMGAYRKGASLPRRRKDGVLDKLWYHWPLLLPYWLDN